MSSSGRICTLTVDPEKLATGTKRNRVVEDNAKALALSATTPTSNQSVPPFDEYCQLPAVRALLALATMATPFNEEPASISENREVIRLATVFPGGLNVSSEICANAGLPNMLGALLVAEMVVPRVLVVAAMGVEPPLTLASWRDRVWPALVVEYPAA